MGACTTLRRARLIEGPIDQVNLLASPQLAGTRGYGLLLRRQGHETAAGGTQTKTRSTKLQFRSLFRAGKSAPPPPPVYHRRRHEAAPLEAGQRPSALSESGLGRPRRWLKPEIERLSVLPVPPPPPELPLLQQFVWAILRQDPRERAALEIWSQKPDLAPRRPVLEVLFGAPNGPSSGCVAEKRPPPQRGRVLEWCSDPLDGTTNYGPTPPLSFATSGGASPWRGLPLLGADSRRRPAQC